MKEILKMFAGATEPRKWMQEPFTFDGYTGATDGYTMIVTEGEIKDFASLDVEYEKKVKGVIPAEVNSFNFLLTDIKSAAQKAPLVDEVKSQGKDVECKACHGIGDVEFTFVYNHREYETDADCPICDGSGFEEEEKQVPTGNKIPDPFSLIQFGPCRLQLRFIDRLIKVIEYENAESVSLVSAVDDWSSPCLFKVGKTKVLIMPTRHLFNDVVVHHFE